MAEGRRSDGVLPGRQTRQGLALGPQGRAVLLRLRPYPEPETDLLPGPAALERGVDRRRRGSKVGRLPVRLRAYLDPREPGDHHAGQSLRVADQADPWQERRKRNLRFDQ